MCRHSVISLTNAESHRRSGDVRIAEAFLYFLSAAALSLFGRRLPIVYLWIVRSSKQPIDADVEPVCDLRKTMDVQSFEPNIFDIDHPAGPHTDNSRDPIRRRLPHLAGFDEPLPEYAEITRTHDVEMGLHVMRQAALGEMPSRME
jgi:hypothetical protein